MMELCHMSFYCQSWRRAIISDDLLFPQNKTNVWYNMFGLLPNKDGNTYIRFLIGVFDMTL